MIVENKTDLQKNKMFWEDLLQSFHFLPAFDSIAEIKQESPSVFTKGFQSYCIYAISGSDKYEILFRTSKDKNILHYFLVDYIDNHLNQNDNIYKNEEYHQLIIYNICDSEEFNINSPDCSVSNIKNITKNTVDSEHIFCNNIETLTHYYLYYDELEIKNQPQNDSSYPDIFEKVKTDRGIRYYNRHLPYNEKELLFSVVIPTFNSEKYIEQALQSVIVQSYGNFELIIVDGISTDSTLDIVSKYSDYVSVIICEKDRNIFDAINKGTYQSRGDYSVFIGSDDLLLPQSLQLVKENVVKNGEIGYFYGNSITYNIVRRTFSFHENFILKKKYNRFRIAHPALYIRKNIFEEFKGFDINYHICADADFELKLINSDKHGEKVDAYLCIFRGGGHSSLQFKNISQVYTIFKKFNAINIAYYLFVMKIVLIYIFVKLFGIRSVRIMSQIKKRFTK